MFSPPGDQQVNFGTQPLETVEVVPVKRFFEPEDAQALQLAGRLQGPLVAPDRSLVGLGRARLLGLVGVDQNHEVVAHRAADVFDLGNVRGESPVVQPKLHRPPALGPTRGRVFGPPLAGA